MVLFVSYRCTLFIVYLHIPSVTPSISYKNLRNVQNKQYTYKIKLSNSSRSHF